MKNFLLYPVLSLLLIMFSCKQNNMSASSAKIVERKMLANGKLMLSYVFKANGKLVAGSLITENKVITADTLTVTFHKENPAESHIALPY